VHVIDLRLPADAALTLVHRAGELFVPDRHTSLRTGDHLLLAVSDHAREATEERLRAISHGGRLAMWREPVRSRADRSEPDARRGTSSQGGVPKSGRNGARPDDSRRPRWEPAASP
jgi:cell volume regulation protein A